MKLSVRLTILLVTVTVVMALVVGWFAVSYSTASQYKVIDAEINAVISSGAGQPVNAVSNATYVVSVNSYDVTLDVIDNHDTVTQVNAGTIPLVAKPTTADIRNSLHSISSSPDLPGFRYRAEAAAGGSYLVVAASTRAITRAAHHLEVNVALVGLIAALLSVGVAYLFTARDIGLIKRLINFAGVIARDDHTPAAPPDTGSPELRELRTSLLTMVGSLHRAIDTERRASREMQRFIGDASHELRTPLTVIKGYSEILDRPDLDEQMRQRALERVRREVLRMDALVTDLLFLTEVREAATLTSAPVPLSDVVADALGNFRVDHPQRRVDQRLAPNTWVRGRHEYVERVINNSLSNIARHTPEGAAVAVALEVRAERAILTVDDAGPGLPDEAYERDSRQFQRFDPARSRESGGTGLGMSIMNDIMTTMGGTMRLTRSPLGGLRLQFEFPRESAPVTHEDDASA